MSPSDPKPSSPLLPFANLCADMLFSSDWITVRISFKTIAANTGEAGHPCEKPSTTGITVHDPSSSLTKVSPAPS